MQKFLFIQGSYLGNLSNRTKRKQAETCKSNFNWISVSQFAFTNKHSQHVHHHFAKAQPRLQAALLQP